MTPESTSPQRIQIIPPIHGKITGDGKLSEPDIHWIVEKWLERHPKIKQRTADISVTRGRWTLAEGVRTEVIEVSVVGGSDIAGYDPSEDTDLYQYFLAEERYRAAG